MVMLDDELIESTYSGNETHHSIQFDYLHSTKKVTMGGSKTVPEFSNIAFILASVIPLSILGIRLRMRHSLIEACKH